MSGHFDDLQLEPMPALPPSSPDACPDGGTCHHACPTQDARHGVPCFRVLTCGPLSAARFPGDRWPDAVRQEHGASPHLSEVNLTQAARWVLALREDGNLRTTSYSAALGTWAELLGLSTDAEAVAVAESMAMADPPVTATVAPF